jgi:transketolase
MICSHAGLTVGPDGASAQCLEDLAIMRVLPNMIVVYPADALEARKATRAFVDTVGPMYMRTSRGNVPSVTNEKDPFTIGKANVMRNGKDVAIIACGIMVAEALSAANLLAKEGIDAKVLNMHTIKPIDRKAIIDCAKQTGAIVTAEEHQIHGGLGSAIAEVIVQECPVPIEMVAVKDSFGESGTPEELLKVYHLKDVDIVAAAKKGIEKKTSASR